MPVKVVGVRFKKAGKVYYFDPIDIPLAPGDHVVVETTRGVEYGEVVVGPREVPEDEVVAPLKQVIRKATPEDDQLVQANKEKEKKAFQVALEKIAAHGLPMKLIGVEQTFDGNKIIFYFTADGRIDFRELVKDLAAVFRTRIELRQIGVRDEAKMIGGLGCCGRELCCASWLADFAPVSIRMAKEQNLSLNPTKISGICGRLMCCLKYENDVYEEAKEGYPEVGTQVVAPEGEGKIVSINIFRKTVSVELQESKAIREYTLDQLKIKQCRGECHCDCPARQD
ncbi:PSP1 domain protein [Desulfotomaculum nigrificans CO-1-SRB]|uniref:PSP1 domain protein n=1 Tax=Desulfotomaculum nigrificans (strain DSM 14880 / VKM B-2319 / CO-1-SRB) TaxID=868595 RepID=F6B3Y2_DESCC|nr:stage 0 sporulation family protein [Desulfotomaculum nigrificans]AEF92947.1 PSP1 domain protein [Desulfotomaculum nigrificans CO-1-SRB]